MLLIWLRSKAKAIANTHMERLVSSIPNTTPMAMPVRAECPKASEKKAIFRFTIMVPIIPNKGVMISTARKAYFIKSYSSQEKIPMISHPPFPFSSQPHSSCQSCFRSHFAPADHAFAQRHAGSASLPFCIFGQSCPALECLQKFLALKHLTHASLLYNRLIQQNHMVCILLHIVQVMGN